MANVKKPTAVFEAVFTGGGVYPEKIPIGKVVEALSAVKRLAAGVIVGDGDEDEDEGDTDVRLLDVKRTSSAVFRFVGLSPELTIHRLRETGKILQNPQADGESEYILRPVKDLSAIAQSLQCSIILRQSGNGHDALARIEANSFARISQSLLVSGNTSITGTVQRVGGATEVRCALRIPTQSRLLFCRVESKEVARKLGDALYQRVVAHGAARWLRHSMRLYSFKVQDIFRAAEGTISDHLQALWDAGMNDWSLQDDPDSLLQEIRGGE